MNTQINNPVLIGIILVLLSPFLLIMWVLDYFACRGNKWCERMLYGDPQPLDGQIPESVCKM